MGEGSPTPPLPPESWLRSASPRGRGRRFTTGDLWPRSGQCAALCVLTARVRPCVLHVCPSSQAVWTGAQGGHPTKATGPPLPAPGPSAPWCWSPALCGQCRHVPGPMVGGGQRGHAASLEWPPQARAPVLGVAPPGGPGALGMSWGRKWLAAPWPDRKRGARASQEPVSPGAAVSAPDVGPRQHHGDITRSSQGHHRTSWGQKGDVTAHHRDPLCCRVLGCGPSLLLPSPGAAPVSPAQLWRPLLPWATHCGPCCPVWTRDAGQSQDSVPAPAAPWSLPQDLARKPLRMRLCPVTLQDPGRNLAGGHGSGPADPRTRPRREQLGGQAHLEHTSQDSWCTQGPARAR